MEHFWTLYYVLGYFIRVGMILVVLRRQMAPGASVAWLGIIFLHPYIGLGLYLLVGESRLGPRRAEQHQKIMAEFRNPARHAGRAACEAPSQIGPAYAPITQQATKIGGMPILGGNGVQFFTDTPRFVDALVADIDAARQTVHLLYYIFAGDDTGRRVGDALERAVKRGVHCRLMVDAMASRPALRRGGLTRKLAAAGVETATALAVAPIRRRLPRMDMRNHRKLSIIDGVVAYAGSHNLINPDYGGRHGNPWYDVTGRFSGPIIDELAVVFAEDWSFETGRELEFPAVDRMVCITGEDQARNVPVQVVPTGPSDPDESYRRLLIAAIQCAQREVILTTPYFVPDEPALLSMLMAADRGVDVKLILPLVPDHFFTAAAGRAHFKKLLDSGVSIYLYRPGLIHSKTATVDQTVAVFGSANLDVRSFNLNFELSLVLYGHEATGRLRAVQLDYLSKSARLDGAEWSRRSVAKQYADRAITLLSPLL